MNAVRAARWVGVGWIAVAAAACGGDGDAGAGANSDAGSAVDGGGVVESMWLPMAPSADLFGWQGVQSDLYRASDGRHCRDAEVVIGMGDQALCYVDSDDALRCAGRIYDRDYGSEFALAGQEGVDQIFISMTSATETGNSICVHRRDDGTAWCLGDFNGRGQYNNGSTAPATTWQRWGTRDDLEELATGTFDQFCGRYADGSVECVGLDFGVTPVPVGTSALGRVWVDAFGAVHIDDTEVYRVGNGRAECQVNARGVVCAGEVFGEPGKVVAGDMAGIAYEEGADVETVCWLDDVGRVFCQYFLGHPDLGVVDPVRLFMRGPVLALALDGYSWSPDLVAPPSRCAVRHDGSLWCVGQNTSGKLGTGSLDHLTVETMVQPPGSVKIRCDEPGMSG